MVGTAKAWWARCGLAACILPGLVAGAQQVFPVPKRFVVLAGAPTRAAYSSLQAIVAAHPPWPSNGAGADFSHSTAGWIRLGKLGRVLAVWFHCGSQNCSFALYQPSNRDYRLLFSAAGWIAGTLPSSGPAPDLVVGWALCAGCNPAVRYRYNGNAYARISCGQLRFGRSGRARLFPQRCTGRHPPKGPPSALLGELGGVIAVTPVEYDALRPFLDKQLAGLPPARRAAAIAGAHAVAGRDFDEIVEAANCDSRGNCPIWIVHRDSSGFRVLVRADGQAYAQGATARFGAPPDYLIRRQSRYGTELVDYTQTRSFASERLVINGSLVRGLPAVVRPWRMKACEVIKGASITPVFCASGRPIAPALVSDLDTTSVGSSLQDATGTLWARPQTWGALLRWHQGRWTPQAVPGGEPASYASIPQMWAAHGGVEAFWRIAGTRGVITWQRGGKRTTIAQFATPNAVREIVPLATGGPLVEVDRGGSPQTGNWMPGQGPALDAIATDGSLHPVYHFGPQQLTPALPLPLGQGPYLRNLRATNDAAGDTWIWMPGPFAYRGGSYAGEHFRGFLVASRGHFDYHASIPGLPAGPLTLLAPWDRVHLLAEISGVGPFLISVQTLTADALPAAETGDIRNVRGVFSVGNAHFVIVGTAATVVTISGRRRSRADQLWRLRNGRWAELVAGLDPNPALGPIYAPHLVAHAATVAGLWISGGDGLWLIPRSGASPRFFNWRQGLKLGEVDFLLRQDRGHLLAVAVPGAQHVSAPIAVASLLAAKRVPIGVRVLAPGETLVAGTRQHLFGRNGAVLQEWTGQSWLQHPLPPGRYSHAQNNVAIDTTGLVWLLPGCYMAPTVIYQPETGRWRRLGNYLFTLSHLKRKVMFRKSRFRMEPIYGPRGQIALWGACDGVSYFDGARWRVWPVRLLPGHAVPMAAPYFNLAGRLVVADTPAQAWEWTGQRWQATQSTVQRATIPQDVPASRVPSLMTCQTTSPDSQTVDSLGRVWWTSGGSLYEANAGQCRLVLPRREAQPFAGGRRLLYAEIGAGGAVFLATNASGSLQFVQLSRALADGN